MTVPTGLAVSGSPISNSGTFGVTWSGTIPAAQIPNFTNTVNGGVPGSGGGTTKFLRADGTWNVPPGGGGGSPGGTNGQVQYNNSGVFGGLTNTQLTADINTFTSSLSGAAPASGGGTANFLRADGAWVAPPGGGGSSVRTQRSVTSSPITVASSDQILNVNINTGIPTCTLPAYGTRSGNAVTFKDVGGNFGTNTLTILPSGTDTIDGQTSVILANNYEAITLVPFNDGVNAGWAIE
jgi:hypothetical protein